MNVGDSFIREQVHIWKTEYSQIKCTFVLGKLSKFLGLCRMIAKWNEPEHAIRLGARI